jgi:hypothetical protein
MKTPVRQRVEVNGANGQRDKGRASTRRIKLRHYPEGICATPA